MTAPYMTCSEARAELEAQFVGTLAPRAAARVRAHAQGCAQCREVYDKLARVASVLEKRALPRASEAALEDALFARLGLAEPVPMPRTSPSAAHPRWAAPRWARLALPLTAGAALAVLLLPRVLPRDPAATGEWSARAGGRRGSAYGVRAFCIAQGRVRAEALPGGRLACAPGSVVQLSYTAPADSELSVVVHTAGGEALPLFPAEGGRARVSSGVDQPLGFSTPVSPDWLAGPVRLQARFHAPSGEVLAETGLTLTP